MFRFTSTLVNTIRAGRWCLVAALMVCLGFAGCTSMSLLGKGLDNEDRPAWARDPGPSDAQDRFHVISNEAREINQHFPPL
ncbi:MAG: hypothetical protein ACYTG0_16125 [Planctomycetota bacterium]|jgi:hypothetical protein